MFRGDMVDNADRIDISKVQMFLFTIVLVLGYAAAIGALLADRADVLAPLGVDMPAFTSSMNVILGLSHATYLSSKAAET